MHFSFLEELKIFLRQILPPIYIWFILAIFFFSFGVREVFWAGFQFPFLQPSFNSIASDLFVLMKNFFLPKGVYLIANNPLSGFLVQLQISSALAFIIVIPFFLFRIIKYIMPALFAEEKIAILKLVLSSTLFFAIGVIFAFTVFIPLTMKFLFYFTSYLDVLPIFSASDFVSLIFSLILVSGIVFLIPIFMTLLSALGVVDRLFWKRNWRFVFLFFLIFSAIITPDGTGITMLILSLALSILYFIGIFLSGLKKV